MVTLRSFKGLRPQKNLAEKVASLPYDVLNSKEARVLAKGNPIAFYHVGKSEIDLLKILISTINEFTIRREKIYRNL